MPQGLKPALILPGFARDKSRAYRPERVFSQPLKPCVDFVASVAEDKSRAYRPKRVFRKL
jgi:hypothetical protein